MGANFHSMLRHGTSAALPKEEVLDYLQDSRSNFWFGSPKHLAMFDTAYFSVFRPTSKDALRLMMERDGTGKGLNIKGKSAKKGKLSGFVPFLQISENKHADEAHTVPDYRPRHHPAPNPH